MKLWLDDVREAPEGWSWCPSVNAAIRVMERYVVSHASLDNDLGQYEPDGGDGHKLVLWMAEYNIWPTEGIRVHTGNPVERDQMLLGIDNYSPYELGYGITRGNWE